MNSETEFFLDKYLNELRDDNAAVFVGAGLSKSAGFVDWAGLLAPIAAGLGLDASKETDLVGVAQFHLNTNLANRHQLNQLLVDQFSDLPSPTENHAILARLPLRTYWTTNYDRLIEDALRRNGKRVDAKYTVEQLATTKRGRDAVVYKMHGDIEQPNKAILTKDDYERYPYTHGAFTTALLGDLVERTFLFLGFSFTDPNLDYILARIRSRFEANQRMHFCITKKRTRLRRESKADFEYAETKQRLITQDLLRFNIKTVFVDDYSDITTVLRALEFRFRRRTIFISGAADEYGSWGQDATLQFVSRLSALLIERNFRITTGFGVGIGGAVVSGAVQQIYSTDYRSIDQQLVLRPFPLGIDDAALRRETYERYRTELISQAGIAIFVSGNKLVDGSVVPSEGVRAEYELAKKKGLFLIPIGASEYASRDLWSQVIDDFDAHFPAASKRVRELYTLLGQKTDEPMRLLDALLELTALLSKE